jgi:hypothetical protein
MSSGGRGPCTHEGCRNLAAVNLAFGRNHTTDDPVKYGMRLWAAYCPFHAVLVCDVFEVEKARKVAA